jgi:hypothetical protein
MKTTPQDRLDEYELSAIYDDAGTPPLNEEDIVNRATARAEKRWSLLRWLRDRWCWMKWFSL